MRSKAIEVTSGPLSISSTTPVRSLRFLEWPIAPIECQSKKIRQAFIVRAQQQAKVRLEFLDIFIEVLLQRFPRLRIAALMFGDIMSPSMSGPVKPVGYTITSHWEENGEEIRDTTRTDYKVMQYEHRECTVLEV